MDSEIIDRLRATMWRRSEVEENLFVETVESIASPLSKELTRALFDTFLPIDDFGSQESVNERLSLAEDQVYFCVLGEEVARICDRAPEHADDIIVRAAIYYRSFLISLIVSLSEEDRESVLLFMRERLFIEPEIRQVVEQIGELGC